MKIIVKILFCYALVASAAAWWGVGRHREVRRLENNRAALGDSLHRYRTRLGEEAASVAALRLRCDEYAGMHAADAARIEALGIRLRRLESVATTATATRAEVRTTVVDTVIIRDTIRGETGCATAVCDTLRRFCWSDGWITVEGVADADSVRCTVESVDTLRQVVHRVPYRFWFIRCGTKGVRQEIVSSNPHTRIVCAEYIELERRGGRRNRAKGRR